MSETLDLYSRLREKTGKTCVRGEKLAEGDYILVCQVLIFNSKGELLIQQRAACKGGWANLWDVSAGGAVLAGETSAQAITRELSEELGISVDLTAERPRICSSFDTGYTDVYIIERDLDPASLTLQEEEVQAVRYASCDEILAMLEAEEFVPYFPSWIRYLFDSRKQYGSFRYLAKYE